MNRRGEGEGKGGVVDLVVEETLEACKCLRGTKVKYSGVCEDDLLILYEIHLSLLCADYIGPCPLGLLFDLGKHAYSTYKATQP